MIRKSLSLIVDNGNGDEPPSNHSGNRSFADVLDARIQRRTVLKGSLAAAVAGLFSGALAGCNSSSSSVGPEEGPPQLLGFDAIPIGTDDTIHVPAGYSWQPLVEWGRSLGTGELENLPFPAGQGGARQADAMGSHHDGMHFFPIDGLDPYEGSSDDGLLVMNHEYVEPRYMHAEAVGQSLSRDAFLSYDDGGVLRRDSDQVLAEMNGHGVSVVRVQKQLNGEWIMMAGDPRNRRITALTPMEIAGPVRGTDFVKTRFSPGGTMTRGTINNCAHGVTPWNTYLTCEENWAGYFRNRDSGGDPQPREHQRYGVAAGTGRYGWESADTDPDTNDQAYARFNAAPIGAVPTDDYRNEPNAFGWVVEIDPFDPVSTPVKRTHLGRFAHEGVVFQPPIEGQPVVLYSGDDATHEYIYKFVSAQPYHRETAGGHLLDSGTLYVAKFNDDGSGEWLPLVWGLGVLRPDAEVPFQSQADVLVNTRLAADAVGATRMDRPEWGAVDPTTRQVYFTLTNNTARTATDAANPRANSRWGHIIRWSEAGGNPAATAFAWDIFLLSGPTDDSDFNGQTLDEDQIHNSPDGLWFDAEGRLWIQSDISESVMNTGDYAQFGNNQMLAADPANNELRRFLTGPLGQEITGVVTTPDRRTMFINVQHPGATITPAQFAAGELEGNGTWPLGGGNYGRSSTVVITKDDGGVIGS